MKTSEWEKAGSQTDGCPELPPQIVRDLECQRVSERRREKTKLKCQTDTERVKGNKPFGKQMRRDEEGKGSSQHPTNPQTCREKVRKDYPCSAFWSLQYPLTHTHTHIYCTCAHIFLNGNDLHHQYVEGAEKQTFCALHVINMRL